MNLLLLLLQLILILLLFYVFFFFWNLLSEHLYIIHFVDEISILCFYTIFKHRLFLKFLEWIQKKDTFRHFISYRIIIISNMIWRKWIEIEFLKIFMTDTTNFWYNFYLRGAGYQIAYGYLKIPMPGKIYIRWFTGSSFYFLFLFFIRKKAYFHQKFKKK